METIIITFGSGNSATKQLAEYPTVGAVMNDRGLAAFLQFPIGSVTATVNGSPAEPTTMLRAGDRVNLVTRANTKG